MFGTFKIKHSSMVLFFNTFFNHLFCLHLCFQCCNSPTQCLKTITQSYSQNRKGEKKKIIYISQPAMFWLLQVINDNGHLPKIQTEFTNGIGEQLYDKCQEYIILFLWYIPFFIHKMEGILKFYLHIIMHEITAFIMPCIERC